MSGDHVARYVFMGHRMQSKWNWNIHLRCSYETCGRKLVDIDCGTLYECLNCGRIICVECGKWEMKKKKKRIESVIVLSSDPDTDNEINDKSDDKASKK